MFRFSKSALFSLSISIFIHKLLRSGYPIYANSYVLNKATARLEFSVPYSFMYCVSGKQNDKYMCNKFSVVAV